MLEYIQTFTIIGGGPMGSAEIVFKVMFKMAVCYVMMQVSFSILQNPRFGQASQVYYATMHYSLLHKNCAARGLLIYLANSLG